MLMKAANMRGKGDESSLLYLPTTGFMAYLEGVAKSGEVGFSPGRCGFTDACRDSIGRDNSRKLLTNMTTICHNKLRKERNTS